MNMVMKNVCDVETALWWINFCYLGKISATAMVKLEHEKNDLIRQLKQAKKELSVAPTREETLHRFMVS